MFRNLKLFWKMMILAFMVPFAVVTTAGIAFKGTDKLKAEYDNLYGFMLIPIVNLDEANLARESLEGATHEFAHPNLPPDERARLAGTIQSEDARMAGIVARYESEWLTTLSPEFTATLAALGMQGLQTDEADALAEFHEAYADYSSKREALLSGAAVNPESVEADLNRMETAFEKLIRINLQFADLSNQSAQAAIVKVRWAMIVAAALVSLIALGAGWQFSQRVVKPVRLLTRAAQQLTRGDLNIRLEATAKDEVGEIAAAFAQMIDYLHKMAGAAEKISRGDLTEDVTPVSEQDTLGNAFARMNSNLRNLVGQVTESAGIVGAAVSQLAATSEQSSQAINQIAATIQQVASGTAQQSSDITRTAASVEQMKRAIDGVANGAQEQATAIGKASIVTSQITAAIQQVQVIAQADAQGSAQAAREARAGAQTVAETIKGMETIRSKVGVSVEKVKEMGQRSDQIGAIVETIDDIASQTNLLALNAAIEAARAGEHGKGFAVVADEVRKLAEKSARATKEIAALIKGIQVTVNEAVAAMNESAVEVETGVGKANESGQALTSILSAVEAVQEGAAEAAATVQKITASANELVSAMDSVNAVVEENTAATEELAAGSTEVTQAIENIASVSEENSAAVEEVSASAEEMSAQVEEVTASAQSLNEMAQALQDLVRQFKFDARRIPTSGDQPKTVYVADRRAPVKVGGDNGNGLEREEAQAR